MIPFYDLGELQIVRALISGKLPTKPSSMPNTSPIEKVIWEEVDLCWMLEPDNRPKCQEVLLKLQSAGLSRENENEAQEKDEREQ